MAIFFASITVRFDLSSGPPKNRFDLATTTLLPPSITATPTGASPTGTVPISALAGVCQDSLRIEREKCVIGASGNIGSAAIRRESKANWVTSSPNRGQNA